jgi:hypothetical protein
MRMTVMHVRIVRVRVGDRLVNVLMGVGMLFRLVLPLALVRFMIRTIDIRNSAYASLRFVKLEHHLIG